MRALADQQRESAEVGDVHAALDSGFDGEAVVGAQHAAAVAAALEFVPSTSMRPDVLYRFGGGTAVATKRLEGAVVVGSVTDRVSLDVVPGTLPFLVGQRFGEKFDLVHEFREQRVLQASVEVAGRMLEGIQHVHLESGSKEPPSSRPVVPKDSAWAHKAHGRWEREAALPSAVSVQEESAGGKEPEPTAVSPSVSPQGDAAAKPEKKSGGAVAPAGDMAKPAGRKAGGLRKEPRPAEPRHTGMVKRLCGMSDRELKRLHRRGHGTTQRILEMLMGTLTRKERSEHKEALQEFRGRVRKVVEECQRSGPCGDAKRPQRPGTSLRPLPAPFEELHGDLICCQGHKDGKTQVWALGVVDRGTGEFALQRLIGQKSAMNAARAAFIRWFSLRGAADRFVSDFGREFLGDFIAALDKMGVPVLKTPPFVPEVHGAIERKFRVVRETVEVMELEEKRAPKTAHEWDVALASVENLMRSEVTQGGYSSSHRGTGRSCSFFPTALTDTPATAASLADGDEGVRRLLEVQALAGEAFRKVVHSRRVREALHERHAEDPPELDLGAVVYFYRAPLPGQPRRDRWRGPAVVVGKHVTQKYYHLDHGGNLVRADFRFVKRAEDDEAKRVLGARGDPEGDLQQPEPAAEERPEQRPELKESAWALPELEDPAPMTPVAVAGPVTDATNRESEPTTQRDGANPGKSQREEGCELFDIASEDANSCGGSGGSAYGDWPTAQGADVENRNIIPSRRERREPQRYGYNASRSMQGSAPVQASDAYALSWEDLSEEMRTDSRRAGIQNYDDYKAWCRGTELTRKQVMSLEGNPIALSGRWVDKPCTKLGYLRGKSRWTPRGYEDHTLTKNEVESPTCAALTHDTWRSVALQRRLVKFLLDVDAAFFASDPLPEDRLVYLLLPPEEQPQNGEKLYRRLRVAVPGTKDAPRSWFDSAVRRLVESGWHQSRQDPCFFYLYQEHKSVPQAAFGLHVDDGKGYCDPDAKVMQLVHDTLSWCFTLGSFDWITEANPSCVFLQILETTTFENGEPVAEERDQKAYIGTKIAGREVELVDPKGGPGARELLPEEVTSYKSVHGALQWVKRTRPDLQQAISLAGQKAPPTRADAVHLTKVARYAVFSNETSCFRTVALPKKGELAVLAIVDAGDEEDSACYDGYWQGGVVLGLIVREEQYSEKCSYSIIMTNSWKLQRTAHGSYRAEVVAGVNVLDLLYETAHLVDEMTGHERVNAHERVVMQQQLRWDPTANADLAHVEPVCGGILHTDSESLVKATISVLCAQRDKRSKQDIADFKDAIFSGFLQPLVHIDGKSNPSDSLTKRAARARQSMLRLLEILRTGVYRPHRGKTPVWDQHCTLCATKIVNGKLTEMLALYVKAYNKARCG